MIKHVAVLDILYQNYLSTGLLLYTVEVRTIACVNLNKVALVDEERHAHLNTCLESSRLCGVGGCITLYSGLTVSDAKVGLHWHFCIEDSTIGSVGNNFHDITFLHILHTDNEVVGDGNLLESLLIHEDAACRVLIEVLIGATLDAHVLKLESHLECAVEHTSVGHVLQLCVHYCVSLSGLSVLEIDADPNASIHADACSFFNVL